MKIILPALLEQFIIRVLLLPRMLTAQIRLLPDFLIIGSQRCGTTSLYNYLIQCPPVASSFIKEVHFFDINFKKGMNWYRAFFPTILYKDYFEKTRSYQLVTGESSPYYIFHPLAPERVFRTIPDVKLIALLRNPVDRAYSHYHHEVRRGREGLMFQDAIEKEEERMRGEIDKILNDENYYSYNHHRFSYLSRGKYIVHINNWMHFFKREQLLVLNSEELFTNTRTVLKRVTEFLDLPDMELKDYRKYHLFQYPEIDQETRKRLVGYFEPYNQRLYEFLGERYDWER